MNRSITKQAIWILGTAISLLASSSTIHAQTSSCSDGETHSGLADLLGNSTYDLGGYAKLDAIFDFDDAGNQFQFIPREIPVDGGDGESTTFHARQTRLNLLITSPTNYGDLDLFFEGDFFGSGNAFRLRHAYGRWGYLLAGQTWSLVVDEDAFIETLDFAGADGGTLVRSPQIRYTFPMAEYVQWKISIEENSSETITPSIAGVIRNRFPVLVSGLRLGTAPNHLYALGAITETRFVPDVGPDQTETIWALGVSSKITFGNRDSFIGRMIGGAGADSLINDETVSATGVIVPLGGIEVLEEYFWNIAYKHYWRDDLRSNFTFGYAQVDNSASQAADVIRSRQYLATNLIWRPVDAVDIGVEYLFGQRENKDRRRADVSRLQFSFIWRLP